MSRSVQIYKHMWINKRLSEFELQGLCGKIVHDTKIDQPIKPWQFVKPVPERRFRIGATPQKPIVKLSERRYVEQFFQTGLLLLGSFDYYANFEHSEIGDNTEGGWVTLLAKTPFGVTGGKYSSGQNNRMFCTYLGNPERKIMKKFGYDSGFVITHPEHFCNAIAESIGALSASFGQCIYRTHKAVLGFPGKEANPYELSHRCIEIVKAGKYLIKHERYSHQHELRFLWELKEDALGAEIVDCGSARKYCKPIFFR
ncbi:MAG: hypothetical protein Q8S94_00440 [Pseudohongiella sp.]|nr:hypothetical protein [Pseudohongiella sp.]